MSNDELNRKAARLMVMRGGRFMKQIGEAWLCADPVNADRLVAAFPEKFNEYRQQALEMEGNHATV